MINDQDVEDFLSHHGIKGQKWGVRKSNKTKSSSSTKRAKNTKRIVTGIRIAAGAAFVAALLSGHSSSKTNGSRRNVSNVVQRHTSLADRLRAEEAQRNGAYKIRKMLKDMGEDVI